MKCGCSARKELTGHVFAQHFTGFWASYKLTGSWTPSWPGPRADTSWALFSLYKVNYTPGGCHSLHKWGKPKRKPYHKIMCQHRDSHWGNPAELLLPHIQPLGGGGTHRWDTLEVMGLGLLKVLLFHLASSACFSVLGLRRTSGPYCRAIWDESC